MQFPKRKGAVVLLVLGLAVLAVGQPRLEDRLARLEPELDARLDAREVQIDPGELLGLMNDNRVHILVLDVQDEADYNLFHIIDSRRLDPDLGEDSWVRDVSPGAVKVVVSTEEGRAETVWKRLSALGILNVYILAGGIDGWLAAYAPAESEGEDPRQALEAALGSRHPASNPDPAHTPKRDFTPKVKVKKAAAVGGGGCG